MGKTAMSGPVYGAKQTLYSFRVNDISSGGGNGLSSVMLAATIVPPGEDWYATEFQAYRGSTGSTGLRLTVNANATEVSAITLTSSLADANSLVVIAADGGEYEGTRIASGSTVTFTVTQSSVAPPSSAVSVTLSGFRRFVSSTRPE